MFVICQRTNEILVVLLPGKELEIRLKASEQRSNA